MKIIVYGTMICPDTVDALELFKKNSIDVDYRDFGDKISYLKEFLAIRDSSSLFDNARKTRTIGVPCIIFEDGSITLNPEDVIETKL